VGKQSVGKEGVETMSEGGTQTEGEEQEGGEEEKT